MITRQELEGQWNEVKGQIQERWGGLTDDELLQARGNANQLVGLIQQRTGEARSTIEEFLDHAVHSGGTAVQQAMDKAKDYAQQAKHAAREYGDQARRGPAGLRAGFCRRQYRRDRGAGNGAAQSAGVDRRRIRRGFDRGDHHRVGAEVLARSTELPRTSGPFPHRATHQLKERVMVAGSFNRVTSQHGGAADGSGVRAGAVHGRDGAVGRCVSAHLDAGCVRHRHRPGGGDRRGHGAPLGFRHEAVATNVGRRVLDSIYDVLPDSVQRHLR